MKGQLLPFAREDALVRSCGTSHRARRTRTFVNRLICLRRAQNQVARVVFMLVHGTVRSIVNHYVREVANLQQVNQLSFFSGLFKERTVSSIVYKRCMSSVCHSIIFYLQTQINTSNRWVQGNQARNQPGQYQA